MATSSARSAPPVEDSFASALEAARPRLESVLGHFRVPPAEADDLLQNVAMSFLRKQDEVLNATQWLCGALRLECQKYWRSNRRRVTEALDDAMVGLLEAPGLTLQEHSELRSDLRRALAGLKPRCRSLLYLRYTEGLADAETAARLGYSVSSIDKIIRRCVTALAGRYMQTSGTTLRPNR